MWGDRSMNWESGFGSEARRERFPHDPSSSRSVRRDRVVAGGRRDGDLDLDEIVVEHDRNPVQLRESLRILARWIARAAIDEQESRNSGKTRDLPPRSPALFP